MISRMMVSRFKGWVYGPAEFLRNSRQHFDGTRTRQLASGMACTSDEARLEFASRWFQPCQKTGEILSFLAWLREWQPRTVVEIGVARGGTTYLLTTCVPSLRRMIGVDFFPRNQALLQRLRSPEVSLVYACGSSRSPEVLAKVKKLLGGAPVDLLFIDGDHSYAGVKADWENFTPLVRPGGWAALHDIMPPERKSDGTAQNGFAVEVDRFWRELQAKHISKTFVEQPSQFGYGIGVVQL
jgi:predicted O-methyltransferase YrrM